MDLIKLFERLAEIFNHCPPWLKVLGCVAALSVLLFLAAFIICLIAGLCRPVPPNHTALPTRPNSSDRPSDDLRILQMPTEVQEGALVNFQSSYLNLNHYVIVTPMIAPSSWVTDGPIHVSPNGLGSGLARFGGSGVQPGQEFAVRILATEMNLEEGLLESIPPNAKVSLQFRVTRIR